MYSPNNNFVLSDYSASVYLIFSDEDEEFELLYQIELTSTSDITYCVMPYTTLCSDVGNLEV